MRAIENSSKIKDIVPPDPFAGSGSTLIGCENLNRVARLIEIDPKYCDVIVRRWENATGLKAIQERVKKVKTRVKIMTSPLYPVSTIAKLFDLTERKCSN